jgi:hydroxymethylglutaryl-CoA reductase (NADPH)
VSALERFASTELSPEFFNEALARTPRAGAFQVLECRPSAGHVVNGVISELVGKLSKKWVGLYPFELRCRTGDGRPITLRVLLKSKPTDLEVIDLGGRLSGLCGPEVATAYAAHGHRMGFRGSHTREITVYLEPDERLDRHRPALYGVYRDDRREAFVLVLEYLDDAPLLNSVSDRAVGWGEEQVATAVRGLAEIHAVGLGKGALLRTAPWLVDAPSAERFDELKPLFAAVVRYAREAFSELIPEEWAQQSLRWIEHSDWWKELDELPKTLIHGDFTPRNIALRRAARGSLRLCAYDWEMATLHVPQRDLIDLLSYTAAPDASGDEIARMVELHRSCIEASSGLSFPRADWNRGYRLALRDFAIERLGVYLTAQKVMNSPFVPRLVLSLRNMLDLARQ